MNQKIQILLLVATLTALGMMYDSISRRPVAQSHYATARPAPDFAYVPAGSTREARLSELKGKIVLLNFWASWCAPCKREFPAFLQLAADHPDNFVFLAVSSDDQQKNMEQFLSHLNPDHTALPNVHLAWDADKRITQGIFHTFRYPETILISQDGLMQRKIIGMILEEELQDIRKMLTVE